MAQALRQAQPVFGRRQERLGLWQQAQLGLAPELGQAQVLAQERPQTFGRQQARLEQQTQSGFAPGLRFERRQEWPELGQQQAQLGLALELRQAQDLMQERPLTFGRRQAQLMLAPGLERAQDLMQERPLAFR